MNKKIIVANWKMNPVSLKEAKRLFERTQNYADKTRINAEVIVAAPFVYFSELFKIKNSKLKIGAQDSFWAIEGAYTGEISPKMLKDLGVDYAIIGHSERRKYIGETDEMINKKVIAALKAGLKVILCVGEPKRESEISNKESGMKKAKEYIKNQLKKDLKNIHNSKFKIHNSLIVAYEPIWAIGTGVPAHPNDALEMIKYIKQLLITSYKLQVRILYGGSVNGKNILDFVKYNEIDGALVGGASIKIKEFKKIVEKIK